MIQPLLVLAAGLAVAQPSPSFDQAYANPRGLIVNDEGIKITGRAAMYYKEVRRMVQELQGRKLDLRESLDVMDDAYAAVWAKLSVIEAVAQKRNIGRQNTHLEQTLMWVDGVLRDGGRNVAVHTQQVFFHHAKNPQSEINEGNRRIDKSLLETAEHLSKGGKAERKLGRLDEVILGFDTRGYAEIKDHLRTKEKELASKFGDRFHFVYVDELAKVPADKEAMRKEFNALASRYQGQGLQKIMEGVIYSRYVGLLLELKTVEYFLNRGYAILQSGRELYDAQGMYITELDTVVRSPRGKVAIVEAKSARVALPPDDVLKDKVLYKLDTYSKYRKELDEAAGQKFDEVIFSFDVGCDNEKLEGFLSAKEPTLSQKYGFPVSFVFLHSGPEACREARRH